MAAHTVLLRVASVLSLFFPIFLLASHSGLTLSAAVLDDGDVDKEYVVDSPFLDQLGSLRGRFLATAITVKKGAHCNATSNNVCNGVSANKGRSLLQCCKKHCRNILGDRNNCGGCGQKCGFGQLCCGGTCTNIGFNSSHCGKCNHACSFGVKCEYGVCGYA